MTQLVSIDPDSNNWIYSLVPGRNNKVAILGSTLYSLIDIEEAGELSIQVKTNDGSLTYESCKFQSKCWFRS